jgi:cytochrome c-type biogenesis protein
MLFDFAAVGLAFLAGNLSLLSPCVLPLAPVVLATAAQAHRLGPLMLALGLTLSFVVMGTLIAYLGTQLGFDTDGFQTFGAIALLIIGVVLVSGTLQKRLAGVSSGLSNWSNALLLRLPLEGMGGQFIIGLVLGLVWTPCVGPTLGAATLLASQGKDLASITLVMSAFALGASLPLLALATLSRSAMTRLRGGLLKLGDMGKRGLGVLMILIGLLIITGLNHSLETVLLNLMPQSWIDLTTRY